ncbi:MAG: NAD(P)H-dependent oxidoreductase subunit E [Thermodesulfobacteriota bacterium]
MTGQADKGREAPGPGAVTGALQAIQDKHGWLPEEELEALARKLDLPLSRIFAVAAFFASFRLSPRGRRNIQVCEGTTCHLLGARRLSLKFQRDLDLGPDGQSPDREYSLERVRCLGCCSLAPVVRLNGETYGRVGQKDLGRLVGQFQEKGGGHEDT